MHMKLSKKALRVIMEKKKDVSFHLNSKTMDLWFKQIYEIWEYYRALKYYLGILQGVDLL